MFEIILIGIIIFAIVITFVSYCCLIVASRTDDITDKMREEELNKKNGE